MFFYIEWCTHMYHFPTYAHKCLCVYDLSTRAYTNVYLRVLQTHIYISYFTTYKMHIAYLRCLLVFKLPTLTAK